VNQDHDIVIIGCGASGGTSAQFARKTDRKSNITIFEKGRYPQYSKCGLPYILSGKIPDFKDLIEFSEEWFKKQKIDLLMKTVVEKIDTEKQIIYGKRGNAVIEKSYSSIIIATGAKPIIPPIENIMEDEHLVNGVFVLRTIDDAVHIESYIEKGKKATIVGAGLIGLEMADCLHKKGMKVTVIEALPNILDVVLDEDLSKIILEKIVEKNVEFYTNCLTTKIDNNNGKINKVYIKNKETNEEKEIGTDLLIISAGAKPETDLAEKIGCKIGETGGIVVNNKTETSMKNIYAIGDCTEYKNFITQKPILSGLGSTAVRQGIAAGVNAAGGKYLLPEGFLGTCTSDFFDIEIACVGPRNKDLENIVSGKFNGMSLPDYYPGGKPITIKIFVDEKTGQILSAQGVGCNAALRINTFACAVLNKINVETFKKIETAYAPPVSPTLDAITLVCDVVSMKMNRKR